MNKQHDFILTLLSSPNVSAADLQAAGYTVDNTGIMNKDDYKKYEVVQENFKKDDGSFDEDAFNQYYNGATAYYNALSHKFTTEELYNQTSWKANNVLAPEGVIKREGPDIDFIKTLNPDRDSWSTSTLGKFKEGKLSKDEIAQSNKVLANPVDVAEGAEPIWHDSPNDSFWEDFWDTRVLAQWDFDADKNGKKTSDPNKVVYHKGELKLNDNGEYFYENLQGRDVYGRKVLSKLNTLTVDGSDINKYDFFDSDDKNEKSPYGVLMKNLALVGTMFIPYVGPVIAGLSMGTQVTNMVMKLSKMVTGSDNPTLSAIEGWTESWDRQGLKSEYAQNNTWCWENMIDVVGDLVGQLREQRMLFEYAPSVVKGLKIVKWNGIDKKAQDLFLKQLAESWKQKNSLTSLSQILKTKEGMNLALDLNKLATAGAQMEYRKYMHDYQKIGEALSKIYMAGLISKNIYTEARANGVDNESAAWMTLGRFGLELGLLYTPVGNAILPELRAEKLAERSFIQNAVDRTATFAKVKQVANTTPDKMSKFKGIFNLGTKLANKGAERVYANNIIDTFKASVANGTEVGIVNDIEEFLNDVVKTAYNSLNDGEENPKLEAWNNMFDRYGMGMVSGLVGGTLTSAFTNYSQVSMERAKTPEQAIQQMIYLEREGKLDKILKNLDDYTLGDKNLSATEYETVVDKDGNEQIIWKAGTKDNNQDLAAKKAIRLQADLIKKILNNNGINLSDESIIKKQSPEFAKEIKYGMLMNSLAAGRLLQKFNTACSDIVKLTNDINNTQPKTDAKKAAQESKGETVEEQSIQEKKKLLKEAIKVKDDILKGKYSQEFIRDVLYEMSPAINHGLIKPSFVRYAEYIKKKPINKISENELADLKTKWEAWAETDLKDYLHIAAGIHQNIVEKTSDVVKNAEQLVTDLNDPILKLINNFNNLGLEGQLQEALLQQQQAGVEITPEVYSQVLKQVVDQNYLEFGLSSYHSLNSEEQSENLRNILLEYNKTANDQTKIERHKELKEQIQAIISDNFRINLPKIVDTVLKRGYINTEVRNNLINVLQTEIANIIPQKNELENKIRDNNQQQKYNELDTYIKNLKSYVDKLNQLPHTPIEDILNQFSVAAKGEPVNITDLLDKLNSLLKSNSSDPSAILLGNEVGEQITQALQLLDIFEAVIEGAKNDSGQVNNLLGYNHYLNLLMPEIKAPEIDSNAGNALIQDLNILRNKLNLFKELNAQNQAQKIGTNHRVQLKFNYLTYERLKSLNIPETWKGVEEWKSALAEAETLENNIDKKILGILEKSRNTINTEMLNLQEALHKLINNNLDKLDSLFTLENFNYFDNTNNILTENSEALNDSSLLGWIVDSGALSYSSFKKMLLDTRGNNIAPISSQEMASYKQLGRLVNGKFYKAAFDSIRKNIVDFWKNNSKEKRVEFLNKLGFEKEKSETYAQHDDILNLLPSLRWVNEIFIEGIPGSGKTNAVLPITMNILQKYYKEYLKRVAYIHGGKKSSAQLGIQKLKELGIDVSGFTAYNKEEFLTEISNWKAYQQENGKDIIPEERIHIDKETGEIKSADKLKYTDNPFTLIVFDEATNANSFEHDIFDNYGNQYGTVTLAFGDLDQDGSYGSATINGINYKIGVSSTNFLPGFKLGISMRSNNIQKAQNLKASQQWVNSNTKDPLELHYYEDETGLYGEKVIDTNPGTSENDNIKITEIEKLINTLKEGEKIGFIFDDETSTIYTELIKDKYKDKIEFFDVHKSSAQGLEAQYYIIDMNSKNPDTYEFIFDKNYKRHIYTAISRSSQGTLIFDNAYDDVELYKINVYKNIQDSETIKQELPIDQINKLVEKDTEFWKDVVKDAVIPKIEQAEQSNDNLVDNSLQQNIPTINEGNGDIPIESIPTLEKQQTVEEEVRQQSIVNEPLPKVEPPKNPTEPVKIDLCFYTFNKFEMGIDRGQNGEAVQWGTDTTRHSNRIDSANGLINLDKHNNHQVRTYEEYRIILDQLHSALLNATDVSNLHDKIQKILTKNNFGISEFSIKFGFKVSAKPRDREFSSKDRRFSRFDKSSQETVQYIHAKDSHSLDTNYKSIVLIIGNSTIGDFLEIPHIQLPHVGTVIDKLQNQIDQRIVQLWNSVKSMPDAVGEFLRNLDPVLANQYPDLVKLANIFRVTNNVFVDLKDWNPYTNLQDLGIQGVYSNRGFEYGRPGYTYDVPYIPITQLSQNSEINISPVLYSKTSSISDGTNVYQDVINPGLPFVLISYDKSITDLSQAWLEGNHKVQRVYIVPPRASIQQYFDNLVNIFNKNLTSIEDIGNDVTAYRLSKTLLNSQEFKDKVNFNLKEIEFPKLEKLISDLENLSTEALVAKLQTVPEGHVKTYKELFRLFLKNIVNPTGQVVVQYKGFDNSTNKSLVNKILSEAGIDGVFYQVRPPKTGEQKYGRYFYKADQNNDWTITNSIGNKVNYTIHGKIDSNVYQGDSQLLDIILNGIQATNNNMYKGNANDIYIKGQYATGVIKQLENQPSNQPLLENFNPNISIQNDIITVNVAPGLTLTSQLPPIVLQNIAVETGTIEQNNDNTITITFGNGTKINIQYDEDMNEHQATVYGVQDMSQIHTEEEWEQLKLRIPEEVRDLVDVPLSEIETVEEIYQELVDNDYLNSEDSQLFKEMLEQKNLDACQGINIIFK